MQAAVGLAQLLHIPEFVEARKQNFRYLKNNLARFGDTFILPEASPDSDPVWFGFPITLKNDFRE
jgi:CDP-6-deoxy-D-xylo-4-hexulose-3-dehydrase